MEKEKKKLRLFDLVSIGLGTTIGSGIFAMLGIGIMYGGRSIPVAVLVAMSLVFMEG